MTELEEFLPHVLPVAPGCPTPTAINALRQAAIRFCEETRAWRCDEEFDVTPDTCAFVCAPAEAELFEIEDVLFNGQPLTAISVNELDRLDPLWRSREPGEAAPRYYTQLAFDTLRIVPSGTGAVSVHGFFKPSEDAEMVPDFLARKFARVIASGALADLLLLPGQPFFNADLAAVHGARFQNALDRNFNLNIRGQQRAPARTKMHFF